MAIRVPMTWALRKSDSSSAIRLMCGSWRCSRYRDTHSGSELSAMPMPLTRKNSAAS
jgi:hypothetical protein